MRIGDGLKTIGFAILGTGLLLLPLTSFAQTSTTYRCQSSTSCIGPARVAFNRYINYPVAGNERYFYDVKDAANTSRGGFYDVLPVSDGQTVLMRIYIHNNADTVHHRSLTISQATARNVRVMASLPNGAVTNYVSQAMITADNASPQTVTDTATLKAAQAFTVEYVPGSTHFYSVNQAGRTLGDDIAGAGVVLGNIRPGGQNLGYVTYKLRIHMNGAAAQNLTGAAPAPTAAAPVAGNVDYTQQIPGGTATQSSSSTIGVNDQGATVTMDSNGGTQSYSINGGVDGVPVDVSATQSQNVTAGPTQGQTYPGSAYTPGQTYPGSTYTAPTGQTAPVPAYTAPTGPATQYMPAPTPMGSVAPGIGGAPVDVSATQTQSLATGPVPTQTVPVPAPTPTPVPVYTAPPPPNIGPAATTEPTTLPATGSAGAGALGSVAIGYALLLYRRSRQRLNRAMLGLSEVPKGPLAL